MAITRPCVKPLLNNDEWYRPITFAQLDSFSIDFYRLVDQAFDLGTINKTLWKFIHTPHPQIATFYALPKLHKPGPTLKGSSDSVELGQFNRKRKQIGW